jgi:hypothetical protein
LENDATSTYAPSPTDINSTSSDSAGVGAAPGDPDQLQTAFGGKAVADFSANKYVGDSFNKPRGK